VPVISFQAGAYRGAYFAASPWPEDAVAELASVRSWLESAEIASQGRHTLARHAMNAGGENLTVAIKSFSRGTAWRDRYFKKNGSKAERSFRAAVCLQDAGVGTPAPVAFMDRWEGGRLVESYYLCAFQDDITSFRDELNRLYAEDPLCRRIMKLMETVALAIADMHDAGVCHRDLGNQNILLRREGEDAWRDVQFIDLNRAHLKDKLTLSERARDISRIDLPSDFLRVFKCMYFRHQHPPAEFQKLEQRYRRRFELHTASRKYRHPIREARQRKKDALLPAVPRGRDLWVWDDRSMQAVSTMMSKERRKFYHASNHAKVAGAVVRSIAPVWSRYRDYMREAFQRPVDLAGRIGMAVGDVQGQEATLWRELGAPAALIRFCAHERDDASERALVAARELKAAGTSVFVALLQDRASALDPARWRRFVDRLVPALAGVADHLEIGHAVNRVKWGVWDLREYRSLVEPVVTAAAGKIPLCGPAVIDFEYHYLAALLDQVPRDSFAALSHHLYVDRRGAPENRQGRFSAVEKFALAKAFAAYSPAVREDRLIVSEVNWPILGTGEYSPVNSPYIIPGSHTNDPSVDEDAYASYMIRYYALALCSGLVDQVYWWRLVARGFGLVDDSATPWRPRPSYRALQVFIRELGDARFTGKLPAPDGVWVLRFEREGRAPVMLAWAHPRNASFAFDSGFKTMLSRDGEQHGVGGPVQLSGSPVYLLAE
jgi:tRNA A-37 threonylcarbamoyl transferase component Bud32